MSHLMTLLKTSPIILSCGEHGGKDKGHLLRQLTVESDIQMIKWIKK